MSDTDESLVIVEHELATDVATERYNVKTTSSNTTTSDAPGAIPKLIEEQQSRSQALQIVSIGSEESTYAFCFHKDRLQTIISRIPAEAKVAVVSVVGAFRTGKSFLLSWFLRYLHHCKLDQNTSVDHVKWLDKFQSLGNDGFEWKAGTERNTTGIWMWSEPHIFPANDTHSSPLAVLLVDTQGMFDNETTMNLTASIFGFSTLLSSYQIYNVDKRIQEDNLQQLALFSEYAKTAVVAYKLDQEEALSFKPFQRIEFLVRDWQHFDEDHESRDGLPDFHAILKTVEEYLAKVVAERDAKDLQDTREQILGCFEKVTCYALPHPGFAVTKKKYSGEVREIEPFFLQLLDRYCSQVFDPKSLQPKVIHGRQLTASELGTYVEAYAELFASGAKFPAAATLLEATATANNTIALESAFAVYKNAMDRTAGPTCTNYIRIEELKEEHDINHKRCLDVFNSMANFGSKASIEVARNKLLQQVESTFDIYQSLNSGRNPLAGLEIYLVPTGVAVGAFAIRWVTDMTCSPYAQVCRQTSEAFSFVYTVALFLLLIVGVTKAQQIRDTVYRIQSAMELMLNPTEVKAKAD